MKNFFKGKNFKGQGKKIKVKVEEEEVEAEKGEREEEKEEELCLNLFELLKFFFFLLFELLGSRVNFSRVSRVKNENVLNFGNNCLNFENNLTEHSAMGGCVIMVTS